MGKSKGNNGSELHRLKPMQEYDEATFNRLYKVCKPVIRNLTRQIDYKRFNLTPDIIQSYFWDKMLFVFNKYYGECTEEHLKARILASLSTFKNKLLRSAYGEQAEYNQSLFKLDDLFDNDKELEDDTEEEKGIDTKCCFVAATAFFAEKIITKWKNDAEYKCNCDCDLCNDCHDDDLLNIRLIGCLDQKEF